MGTVASGGVTVINDDVARGLGISPEVIGQVAEREGRELLRREQAYREGRPFPEVTGKVVIVVDDGLATGSSMRAAVEALQRLRPAAIVVAVPAAPESTCRELGALADKVVCATTPSPFFAVGESYWDFTQTRCARDAAARDRGDLPVIELNRKALRRLRGEARLEVIAGASHLFSEPGALEHVARLAREWFTRHLHAGRPAPRGTRGRKQPLMTTADPSAAIAEELRLVQDDIARLRETAADLRRRIGERDEEPTDPEERSALIEAAEEQEALIDQLEARRVELFRRLGHGS